MKHETNRSIESPNSKNHVFLDDNPGDKWQMPQGGVELNEPL